MNLISQGLSDLGRDALYGLRMLANAPGFAAVGIVSLALGIGVSSVFFSEINTMVLRPLPAARNPEALVAMDAPASYPYFERYRDRREVAAATAAFAGPVPFGVVLEGAEGGGTLRIFGHLVSPEYFSTIGVEPAIGRFFDPETDKAGTAPVVVVSDRFWRARLHADPRVVGQTLRLNGKAATIAGVGPKDFLGVWPMAPADLFVPVTSGAPLAPELGGDVLHRRDLAPFRVVFRLAAGVKLPSAEAALDAERRHLDEAAGIPATEHKGRQVRLIEAGGMMPMPADQKFVTYTFSGILMGLIVSLACTNLANLLLARGSERRKEIAMRLALGASRSRLVRQLLTECVVLALAGGAGGIAFTYWMTNLISSFDLSIAATPFEFDVRPDLRVLVVTLALTVVVGVAFGLAPALAATHPDVAPALKAGGSAPLRGYRRFGLRNLLVAYQVASSLMLLLITGFIVLGYGRSTNIDPGFDTANLYLLQLDPAHDGYNAAQSAKLLDTLRQRLSRLSAVRVMTLADAAPFGDFVAVPNARFSAPRQQGDVIASVVRQRIGKTYFATLGVPLEQGREFTPQNENDDRNDSAVINETAARELFGSESPVGRRIRDLGENRNYTVIGVARDLKPGFISTKPAATVYLALTLDAPPAIQGDVFEALNVGNLGTAPGATIVIRGPTGADAIAAVRGELAAIDPQLTVFNVRTMREHIRQMNSLIAVSYVFYSGVGLFGLILACIGLAGVTAYAVAQRHKEIGIRMALGARSGQVLRLVLREGAALVAAGSVAGFVGAFFISRALSALTAELAQAFGATSRDPLLLIGAPLLLASLAMLACYLPARRATHIDPLAALRQE